MDEIIHCPSCRRKLQLPESYMGKQVQCPSCQETFVAQAGTPMSNPAPPAAPPPPSSSYPMQPPESHDDDYPPEDDDFPPPRRRRRRRRPRYDDDYDDYDDYRPRRRSRYMTPHRGGGILAMGIISIFICGPVLGIIAWVMGSNDLREMRAGRMDPQGEGMTRAGLICGIVGLFLHVALGCLWMIAVADGPRRW